MIIKIRYQICVNIQKKTSIEYKTRLRNPTAGSVNFFMMQSIYYLSIVLLVLHSLCSCYNDHVICTNNRKKMVPRLHRIYTNVSSIKFPDSGNLYFDSVLKNSYLKWLFLSLTSSPS